MYIIPKNFIKTTLTILMLASTLSTANAKSITDKCNTGRECAVLGGAYVEGKGVKQDYVKAVKFFQKACDLDEGWGCGILGAMYKEGIGVKQDDLKAVKFYQKACDLNDSNGCSNLGVMYKYGTGVRKSTNKALKYYGKACDLKVALGCEYYAKLKQQ